MAKIAFCGVGKLGMPFALVVAKYHDVVGYDVSPFAKEVLATKKYPYREEKVEEYLQDTTLRMVDTVDEMVQHATIVNCLVQTPHLEEFEGISRLPEDRADFDYTYLKEAVSIIVASARKLNKRIIINVMSTVLPGTVNREIKPLLDEKLTILSYTPAFPSMGFAIPDLLSSEFILLGVDNLEAAATVEEYYKAFLTAPIVRMSVASAEACKVFYNSFISSKIGLSSAWMEICHRLGANVDDITKALSLATKRLISPAYLKGGLPDGGGCLSPGSVIYTENGPRPISSIWQGDRVLSSDGKFHTVIDTYKRPYKGPMVSAKVAGLPPALFTPEHPFFDVESYLMASLLTKDSQVYFPKNIPQMLDLPNGNQKIEECKNVEFEGTVWNLNVADTHDYVSSAGTVKNCHPRDNIALSWLSRNLGMRYDFFGDLMKSRESQTDWLADLCIDTAKQDGLDKIVLLGKAFKRGTNLTVGSSATLLFNLLSERAWIQHAKHGLDHYDPHVDEKREFTEKALYFISTNHDEFYDEQFLYPEGSTVIDPWGLMKDRPGIRVIRVGRH